MLSVHSCPVGQLGSRDTGGMSVYIREIARELGRLGHTVDIFTRAHDPADDQIVEIGPNARIIHLQVGEVERMHKLVLYAHLADMACAVERFRKDHDLQYDMIHSHYWLSGWVGRHLQRWWDVPHVGMFHTLGAVKNAIGIGEEESELRVVNEKEIVAECDRTIAHTTREKADLVRYCAADPDRVGVVACGVNLGQFHRLDKQAARQHLGFNGHGIALFVGRIDPLKGVDRLIQAMPGLRDERNLSLVVVGGGDDCGPELERLENMARSLRIQDGVSFVGTVRHEDLPLYYSAADVCVVPSHHETFGLVALESLACGTPVVATRVGGMESVIRHGENGYLLDDNSPERLADGISSIVSGRGTPIGAADAIRESVSGFGWSSIARKVAREYRAALDRPSAR
jgi:D-inositol-3-phosphate glycosyltransferase